MPDSSLIKACLRPNDLGDKELTQKQIEKLWSSDRARLLECAKRHGALTEFYLERDRLLKEAM